MNRTIGFAIGFLTFGHLTFAQNCASHWEGRSLNGEVRTMYADSIGGTSQLLVGGAFSNYLVRMSDSNFVSVAPGLHGDVWGIVRHNDGSGSTLYATGFINVPMPGAWTVNYARLTSGEFTSFGGPGGPSSWAGPAISYDFGQGPKFLTSGGFAFPCDYVAQWNGATWECLGGGLGSVVHEAVIYNDGTGPALFCVGSLIINDFPFEEAIGVGKWNGVAWSPIGGVNGYGQCCVVHDDGSGPELFVGGSFTRAGVRPYVFSSCIAKWNGQRWAPLGTGTDRVVRSLASFDDGSGMKLYAAGDFTRAGTATVQRMARWDGTAWSACPAGGIAAGTIDKILPFRPDGSPSTNLYVGGVFTAVAGTSVAASNFAILHPAAAADFNRDGVLDFFDYLDFVDAFAVSLSAADFNHDLIVDFFDYLDFVDALSGGCG